MRRNFALKIAYDGTDFLGWQKTSFGSSIEESLQSCLEKILQESLVLQAASRTDKGVHAEGQWINFYSEKNFSKEALLKSLNALLPRAIKAISVHEAPFSFHPTLHALQKEYQYKISFGPVQLPQKRKYYWHVSQTLNVEHMVSASHFFLGTHDFSSFCNFRKNLNYKDKIRHLEKVECIVLPDDEIVIYVQGDQFLYKMVRNIVGTLVYVGLGKIAPQAIPEILEQKKRPAAGITAPAHGLTLKKIYYPQEFIVGL